MQADHRPDAAAADDTDTDLPRDGRLRIPDGASAHRVRTRDGAFDATLVLFAPADTERLQAAARRSGDARVDEHLRTRQPETTCTTDPDGSSAWHMLCATISDIHPVAGSTLHTVFPRPRGVRGPESGWAPAALVTTRHDEAHVMMDSCDAFVAAEDVPADYAALLAGMVPIGMRTRVLRLLRDHTARLSARRRAAAAIERAWCRYDAAPHGPRARYLRDLERGWTPDGRRAGAVCVRAMVGLLSSTAAYRAYGTERMAALGGRLGLRDGRSDRMQLRLASLYELSDPRIASPAAASAGTTV